MDRNGQSKPACLLLHGFTGTPNEVRALGDYLTEHGLAASIPTLPGHATHSADLFNFTWRDWVDHVQENYEALRREFEKVFVCGLSMGGVLALNLAATTSVRAVISLSAPARFPMWQKAGVRLLKRVRKFRYKQNGEDVSDTSAREWLGSYRRYPFFAVQQLFDLVDHVREKLPEIRQPILIIHSKRDHTIPFSNSVEIFDSVSSTEKRKIDLERSYHVITADVEKEIVQKAVLDFIHTHANAAARQPEGLS